MLHIAAFAFHLFQREFESKNRRGARRPCAYHRRHMNNRRASTMDPASVVRLFVLAALWGGSFLFLRIAAPVLGATTTAFARVLLGALGLVALMAAQRVPMTFNGRLGATLALGAINSGVPFLMFAIAAK